MASLSQQRASNAGSRDLLHPGVLEKPAKAGWLLQHPTGPPKLPQPPEWLCIAEPKLSSLKPGRRRRKGAP